MSLFIHFFKFFKCGMRIDLGRCYTLVTQKFLYHTQLRVHYSALWLQKYASTREDSFSSASPPLTGSVSLNYRPDSYKAVHRSLLQKKPPTFPESFRFLHQYTQASNSRSSSPNGINRCLFLFPVTFRQRILRNPHLYHPNLSIPKVSCR